MRITDVPSPCFRDGGWQTVFPLSPLIAVSIAPFVPSCSLDFRIGEPDAITFLNLPVHNYNQILVFPSYRSDCGRLGNLPARPSCHLVHPLVVNQKFPSHPTFFVSALTAFPLATGFGCVFIVCTVVFVFGMEFATAVRA